MKSSTFLLAVVAIAAIGAATFTTHAEPKALPPGVTRVPVTFSGGHEVAVGDSMRQKGAMITVESKEKEIHVTIPRGEM